MQASATLDRASPFPAEGGRQTREGTLERARELDRFLRDVEKRAFRIAQIALRDPDDALDVVQDSMLQLVRVYGERPGEEWRPLFHRILSNRIRDCQRRRRTRGRVFAWWTGGRVGDDEDEAPDPVDGAAGPDPGPAHRVATDAALAALDEALHALPDRQQQAFLLRNFEGLNVADTAAAMGCTEGSVKTHHFRAVQALRARLGEHGP